MNRSRSVVGGASLIVAAIGFVIVFSWLAKAFGYPDVLDGDASIVLPQLLALGGVGRLVWTIYALLPLLLIPAALGAATRWSGAAPEASRWSLVLGILAAAAMVTGLARWPTIHWALAERWMEASPDARASIASLFGQLNRVLGNVIGEFVGELALSGFFLSTARALQVHRAPSWQALAGYLVGALGLISALRNLWPTAQGVSAVNNIVLPIWLIVLGVLLMRRNR